MGSKKPKTPKPSPAQQQLEKLQIEELSRVKKEEEALRAFTAARNSSRGRRSLIATSAAGTNADFRVGPNQQKAAERNTSVIQSLQGADLEKEIRRRGAISTRTVGGSAGRFTPMGFVQGTPGTSLTTIDFGKL